MGFDRQIDPEIGRAHAIAFQYTLLNRRRVERAYRIRRRVEAGLCVMFLSLAAWAAWVLVTG